MDLNEALARIHEEMDRLIDEKDVSYVIAFNDLKAFISDKIIGQ